VADIQSLLQLEDSYDFVLNLSFGDSKFLTQANSGDFDYIENKSSHKIFSLFVGEKLRKI